MKEHDVSEQAFKNGYEKGKQEVAKEIFEEIKQKRRELWYTNEYTMFQCWCKAEEEIEKKYIGE